MFSLKNKVIIITGGNGLLGRQMVMSYRKQGAKVFSADINFSDDCDYNLLLDITDFEAVENAVNSVLSTCGRIDAWVNNAYPRTKDWGAKFENIPSESWSKNVDMHLNGYFACCQIVLEQMKKQGFGSFINMSSIYGFIGPDFTVYEGTEMTMPAAYAAIKGGLTNLTRYLASYYGQHQVRVNTVSPGGIFDNQPELFVANYSKKVPLRRMGRPDDIVSAVNFLLSDESSYITGHNLVIDGGWSIV